MLALHSPVLSHANNFKGEIISSQKKHSIFKYPLQTRSKTNTSPYLMLMTPKRTEDTTKQAKKCLHIFSQQSNWIKFRKLCEKQMCYLMHSELKHCLFLCMHIQGFNFLQGPNKIFKSLRGTRLVSTASKKVLGSTPALAVSLGSPISSHGQKNMHVRDNWKL